MVSEELTNIKNLTAEEWRNYTPGRRKSVANGILNYYFTEIETRAHGTVRSAQIINALELPDFIAQNIVSTLTSQVGRKKRRVVRIYRKARADQTIIYSFERV